MKNVNLEMVELNEKELDAMKKELLTIDETLQAIQERLTTSEYNERWFEYAEKLSLQIMEKYGVKYPLIMDVSGYGNYNAIEILFLNGEKGFDGIQVDCGDME